MITFAFLKQHIEITEPLLRLEGVGTMSRTKHKYSYCDIIEDTCTDDIHFVICPLEPEGEDMIGSCEMNYTTGQYYCHNCKRYGPIAEIATLLQNKLLL